MIFHSLQGVKMISTTNLVYWLNYALIRMKCLPAGRARFYNQR